MHVSGKRRVPQVQDDISYLGRKNAVRALRSIKREGYFNGINSWFADPCIALCRLNTFSLTTHFLSAGRDSFFVGLKGIGFFFLIYILYIIYGQKIRSLKGSGELIWLPIPMSMTYGNPYRSTDSCAHKSYFTSCPHFWCLKGQSVRVPRRIIFIFKFLCDPHTFRAA